jgi:aspartate aminotransferase
MHLSKLAMSIAQSATLKLNELAGVLKAEGKPVIPLGGGVAEEKIPSCAPEEAGKNIYSGIFRYTPTSGTAELKKEICLYTKKHYGLEPAPKNIVVSSGAKQAIYNFLMAVINPGDQVVFPAPYWVSYPEMVKMVYGVPVAVPPRPGELVPTAEDV